MYQMTDSGLAAEITGKGTKYYKNTDLNKWEFLFGYCIADGVAYYLRRHLRIELN
jgi:hypothetical protein